MSLLGVYGWPLIRIGGFVMVAPGIAGGMVPGRVRLIAALALTLVIAPLVPATPAVDAFSLAGALLVLRELLIGIAFGFFVNMAFEALTLAGNLVANGMGLGFAVVADPQRGANVPVLAQFFWLIGMMTYFAIGGHLALIKSFADTFVTQPIGAALPWQSGAWAIVDRAASIFANGVLVALPAVTAVLLANLAFAVASRAAPTLNIFAVGFPATLAIGLSAVAVSLGVVTSQAAEILAATLLALNEWFGPGQLP